MRFVGNIANNTYLSQIIEGVERHEIYEVLCSVAYVQIRGEEFFKPFLLKNIPLTFWGRYDKGMPIHIDTLHLFHRNSSERFRCYLVRELFHPKVYWFKGYGCYIGSANIGKRAWQDNVEAGIFYTDDELEESGLRLELDRYFNFLKDDVKKSILTDDLMKQLEAQYQRIIEFDKNNSLEDGVNLITKYEPRRQDALSALERERNEFLEEWNRTCGYVKEIGKKLQMDVARPSWIPKDIPLGTHADQFLHAFYYTRTRAATGVRKYEYDAFYKKNKSDVEGAIKDEIDWWRQTQEKDFPYEKEFIETRAPRLRTLLSKTSLSTMTEKDFIEMCGLFHSFYNVARYCRAEVIGVPPGSKVEIRLPLVAKRIFHSVAPNGKTFREVLFYLFYGGPQEEVNHRLFDVTKIGDWFIQYFGESCYGELVGWAFPDIYVPRNDRSNKALRGLGYNVVVRNPNKEDEDTLG